MDANDMNTGVDADAEEILDDVLEDTSAPEEDGQSVADVSFDEGLEDEIITRLNTVQHLLAFSRKQNATKVRSVVDHKNAQERVLDFLSIKDGVATKTIARIVGISGDTLTDALDKLAQDGLVSTSLSDGGRQTVVVLTEKGKETLAEAEKEPDVLDGFSDDELELLDAFLNRMITNLQGSMDDSTRKAFKSMRKKREFVLNKLIENDQVDPADFGEKPRREGRGGFGGRRDDRGGRGGRGFRDERGGRERGGFRGERGGRGFRDERVSRGRDSFRGGRDGFRGGRNERRGPRDGYQKDRKRD